MSFNIFQADTYINASELKENFEWVGNGSWLPRGGVSLAATTLIYNQGSASYKWANVYVNNINLSGNSMPDTWNLVSAANITTASNAIEFTSLNGNIYKITGHIVYYPEAYTIAAGTITLNLIFNNDSSTHYGFRELYKSYAVELNVAGYSTLTSLHVVEMNRVGQPSATLTTMNFESIMISRHGSARIVFSRGGFFMPLYPATSTSGNPFFMSNQFGIWNNENDTITSIKFYMWNADTTTVQFLSGSSIQLWSLE